ncbi:MAG: mechanosensitive ion channel [Alphaproteobacteria bacterium]
MTRWFILAVLAIMVGIAAPGLQGAEVKGSSPPPPPPSPVAAAPQVQVPFAARAAEWTAILDWAQRYIASRDPTPERSQHHLDRVKAARLTAGQAKEEAQKELEATQSLMDALGPPPEEGAPPETPEIAGKRRQYNDILAQHRTRVAQAEVALTQAKAIESAISDLRRLQLLDRLQRRLPLPVAPDVVGTAAGDFFGILQRLALSPFEWYERLTDAERDRLQSNSLVFVIILVVILVAGALVRRTLLRLFGHDPKVEAPTYSRRLLGAVAEAVARGMVPAAFFGGIYLWMSRPGTLFSGLFEDMLGSLMIVLFFLVQLAALSRVVLAPRLPAWRLTALAPDNARLVNRRILILATVFAIDMFLHVASRQLEMSPEFTAVYRLIFLIPEAIGIMALCRPWLWAPAAAAAAAAPAAEEPAETLLAEDQQRQLWAMLRRGVTLVALLGVGATVAGYADLGTYLVHNLLFSGAAAGGIGLFRGLLQELVSLLMDSPLVRHRSGISLRVLQVLDFWMRMALDPVLLVVGLMVIGPMWGVPRDDLMRWAGLVLTGIPIGNVTISIVDILTAVATFFAAMVVTRAVQRRLLDRILPATHFDISTRHSLVAGVGYLGVVVAAAVAITVAGVDLSSLALLAGALSVGIGFGLQNIVNNFVSGLILLIERPIRVGDWVVVGTSEGLVRRISIRATELETWHRASVIIPNADILSGKVMNWTLKDKLGRIDIKVGVAYGSDLDKVRDVMLECATGHPQVLGDPEPFVVFQDFGDSALLFELRCFTSDVFSRGRVASEMRFELNRRFREEGIDIPYPQRTVHVAPAPTPGDAEAAGLAPAALARSNID